MSTKSTILSSESIQLYEELFDENFTYISADGPGSAKVQIDFNKSQRVSIAIPNEIMDEIALAWCKKRKLQGALGGPVGNEYGSPDSGNID